MFYVTNPELSFKYEGFWRNYETIKEDVFCLKSENCNIERC